MDGPAQFSIGASDGQLSVISALDREVQSDITLLVTVTDSGEKQHSIVAGLKLYVIEYYW